MRFAIPIRHGWTLLLPIIPLCVMSILTIHATTGGRAAYGLSAGALDQLKFMVIGALGLAAAIIIGYQRLGRWAFLFFSICLGMLLWLMMDRWINLPFVDAHRNAWRWLRVGPVQIQPSELTKIAYILALAWYLRYRRNYRTLLGLVAPFVLTLVPMALILVQPDLGTVLLFLPVLFAMLYTAGAKAKHLMVIVLLAMLAAPFFWFQIKSYQQLRIAGVVLQSQSLRNFLLARPELWDRLRGKSKTSDRAAGINSRTSVQEHGPDDTDAAKWRRELTDWQNYSGYQLVHSKIAIGSGGVYGQAWRNTGPDVFVDYNFLPENNNDFIFAMVAHQWGLLGSLLLLCCYAAIVVIGLDIATVTNDPFGRLIAVGMSTLIAVQTLTNLCMTVGIGPVTGVTLPFVSAGGSSVVSSFLCIGLLISVVHRRPMLIANPPFVFNEEAEKYGAPTR